LQTHAISRFFYVLLLSAVTALHGGGHDPAEVYSVAKSELGQLADVVKGRALFSNFDGNVERLSVWDIEARKVTAQAILANWGRWGEKAPRRLQAPSLFKLERSGSRVVAVQAPWIVVIDLRQGIETHRDLFLKASPTLNTTVPFSGTASPKPILLAVSPADDSIAVASNLGDRTSLFLYDADLRQTGRFFLGRYVQDLDWSPSGRTVAVLYAARYDERRRLVGSRLDDLSPQPDVWLFDIPTGRPSARFSTGSSENQLLFSADGNRIYTINTYLYGTYLPGPGLIRVFEIPGGRLIQTIRGPKKGVRDHMELSPDGRFVAADATTERKDILRTIVGLETIYSVTSRILVINVESGDTVFERHAYGGNVYIPSHFGFSRSGRLLLADMDTRDSVGTVTAYSLGRSAAVFDAVQ
jgi:WD40 repeat protein